ncbi:hypothetical protein Acid345_4542 [Candidatus Koribacter versatilis Ellin345]|uniref:Inositolphosphotransferase Aur1/Ipt1 domain-containing protein n=1 Tax=Koribacter versatilis (strain Ellin345) TaxID=204669 RepID=Q1IHV8_KORVE|nr:phosphatase PAP2 family protein [Candidatus Koribacter versatilis]ABF43542.1 hypothetical protein Acid345_4542 [Candidatus Koribacter versatilis Ellin345]
MSAGLFARELGPAQKILATAALAFAAFGCALHPYVYHDFLIVPYFAVGLACILILQLRVMPSVRDAIAVVVLGLALLQVDLRLLGYATSAMAVLSLFGLASLLVLGWRAIWGKAKADALHRAFVAAIGLGVCVAFTGLYIERSAFWQTKMYDLFLYSFDASLGGQWTFRLAQFTAHHPGAHFVSAMVYNVVLVPPALVYAALLNDERRARTALWAFLIVGPLACVCFLLFPATGPVYAFKTFPMLAVPAGEIARLVPGPVGISGPRNAIPSLHFAWVLLAYWNSRDTKAAIRVFCAVMLALTIYATLETGEHYGVDLLVAVPFALGIQALAMWLGGIRSRCVTQAIFVPLGITVAWFVLLRFCNRVCWVSAVVPWAAVLLTLGACLYLYRRLVAVQKESGSIEKQSVSRETTDLVHAGSAG